MGFEEIWDEEEPPNKWLLRSVPAFPDPDPAGTTAMWERLRVERNEAHVVVEDEDEFEITVTQEAEEFDEPISALGTYVKLAVKSGWDIVNLGHSRAFAKGKPFKSGANEGQSRPDQNIETQWLYAEKEGCGRIAVSYTIINDTTRGTMTARRHNGTAYGDRELKSIIKGES